MPPLTAVNGIHMIESRFQAIRLDKNITDHNNCDKVMPLRSPVACWFVVVSVMDVVSVVIQGNNNDNNEIK